MPVRTDSNRRLYSDNDIVILARVRHWTEERGVNIAGVKVILEMEQDAARRQNGSGEVSPKAADSGPAAIASGTPRNSLPAYAPAFHEPDGDPLADTLKKG